jgi:YfiH family protein
VTASPASAAILLPDWDLPAGVRAAITTRQGGCSSGPWASNNLALHVADAPAAVARNRQQLQAALGLAAAPQWLEQIHGSKVVEARADDLVRTADASFSREPGVACAVLTADCLPLLLCDAAATQVAAVHAGWRGLAGGVIAATVATFAAPPAQLRVYLGPAISQPAFEVGIDVLEACFAAARSPAHADAIAACFAPSASRPLHFHADIYALARAELAALGVTSISGGSDCTYADADRFYSYRRDDVCGRMASLIWLT